MSIRLRPSLLGIAVGAIACSDPPPPTDTLVMVTSPMAPALPGYSQPKKTSNATPILHEGDLVWSDNAEVGRVEWAGPMEGVASTRNGAYTQGYRSKGDARVFLFTADLKPGILAPSATWFCSHFEPKIAPDAKDAPTALPCESIVRRIHVDDDRTVAFAPAQGMTGNTTPIALAEKEKLFQRPIEGVSEVRVTKHGATAFLIVETRWVKPPNGSGGRALVLALSHTLETVAEVTMDEVDASDTERVVSRIGDLRVEDGRIRFTGARRVVSKDGAELENKPFDDVASFGAAQ